jgi:signal transduction histidine kinase
MTAPDEDARARAAALAASASAASPDLSAGDYGVLIDEVTQCILIHEASTKNILWANPAACAMLEFTLDEIRPLKAPDMSSPARQYSRSIGRAWLQDAAERGHSRIQWRYRSKSGREFPTDALATRVELARGPAVMVQFRDIEREQALEHTLARTEALFRAMARQTSIGALVLTPGARIEFATDGALAQLSAEQDELIGANLADFADIIEDGQLVPWPVIATSQPPVVSVRLRTHRPAQSPRWLGGSIDRIFPGDETEESLILTLHDITDRVAGEIRRERDIKHENYLARYNAMGDMAMAIAHELAQPLSAASNYLDGVIGREGRDATVTENAAYGVAHARHQIERAREIVSSVRDFVSHLEHVNQVVDLNAIVGECLYFIEIRARAAQVKLDVRLCPNPVWIRCERVLTGQVVLNLCFNAVDEMADMPPGDREVRIRTEMTGTTGTFLVEDRGRGLSHLPGEDVFGNGFTSKGHGHGIGLALSYRIITRQRGTIRASAAQPCGAAFSFSLPAAKPGSETSASPMSTAGEN